MNRVWTPLCARMGIDVPIFGFAHDVQVVAAITNAGGYGVYGATRRFPHEIKEELKQIRALVGDKPVWRGSCAASWHAYPQLTGRHRSRDSPGT